MNSERLEFMKDCVKKAFDEGCQRGRKFEAMRHAIIVELKILDFTAAEIKDMLSEWNKRCERVLGPGEEKRQLFGYVDWVFKHECKIGCNGLRDYCIGEESCQFHRRNNAYRRDRTPDLPFDLQQLKKFLDERFKVDGYVMLLVINALAYHQIEKLTGEIIYIGVRTIARIIRDKYSCTVSPMEVYRKINKLIDEGMLELVERGKGGGFSRKANGYRFLRWPQEEYPY